MYSKKLVSLQKKVREKINSIHEQRNIFVALVDSFVSEADEQADRLLAEKDPNKFMHHYLDVMKILDQSYNSCVMLTAEVEGLYENVDMTATELLSADQSDEEETSLKGATAAPHYRPSQNKVFSIDSTVQRCNSYKPPNINPSDCFEVTLQKQLTSSTPVKLNDIPNQNEDKNDNTENLIDSYTKPITNKSVMNIGTDSVEEIQSTNFISADFVQESSYKSKGDNTSFWDEDNTLQNPEETVHKKSSSTVARKSVQPETKKRVESKHNRRSLPKSEQPRLDTDVAARFLRSIIVQAKKDNENLKSLHKPDDKAYTPECRNQSATPSDPHITVNPQNMKSGDATYTKETQEWDLSSKDSLNQINVNSSATVANDRIKQSPESSSNSKPEKSNNSDCTEKTIDGNRQNDLACVESSASFKTAVPLEMNITTDNVILTASSIKQMTLPTGRHIPVVVSETCSPWNFYVQIVNSSLEKLMKEIRIYMASEGMHCGGIDKPEQGMVCLAQFSQDQLYYRARVTKISIQESPTTVDVLYIDYGNAEKRNSSHLRNLPSKFAALPAQAIYCALAKIAPNNKYGIWSEQDTSTFSQLANSKIFYCTLIQPSQHPDIPNIVDLFFNSTLQGNWTVFIQTVLMSNNVGRMVSLHEQLASFMVIFRLSPKSNASVSPPGSELVKNDGTKDLNFMKQKSPVSNKKDSPVRRQKSSDSNESGSATCQPQDTSSYKINNCDKSKSVIIKDTKEEGKGDKHVQGCSLGEVGEDKSNNIHRDNNTSVRCKQEAYSNNSSVNINRGKELTLKEEPVVVKADNSAVTKKENDFDSGIVNKVEKTKENSDVSKLDDEIDVNANEMTVVDVPPLQIDTNASCYNVMVSFVKSPANFYVHIVSEVTAKTLNVMSNNINSHHGQLSRKQLQKLSKALSPKVNDVCCAQFCEDNKFYRAQILELQAPNSPKKISDDSDTESFGKASVFYMDYGDVECVPKRRLFPLPKELQSIPPLAVKCSLAYVKPINNERSWSSKGKEHFNKLTDDGKDKILKMIIVSGSIEKTLESFDSDPLKIILVDGLDKEEVCINMDLIRQGFAELDLKEDIERCMKEPSTEKMHNWDPMMEDYLSLRNSYKVDVDDAGIATVGYKAQDETRICKYYNYGDCWRGERCPYRHVEMLPDGVTLDQDLVYGAVDEYYMEKILPEPGTWVAVEVTTILSPGHFYISLPFGKSPIDDLKEKEEADKKDDWQLTFEQLISEMQMEYNKANYNEDTTVDKAPGEIVAARYPCDGKWYRARVLIVEENRMRVFFVDFGNREWLRYENIRTILPDFLHLPFQAVECFLMNIEPVGSKYSSESKKRFKELVDGKVLVAFVKTRSYSGSMWIDLYDTTGDEDIDIAKVLSAEKLVQDTGSTTTTSSKQSHHSSQTSLILVPG